MSWLNAFRELGLAAVEAAAGSASAPPAPGGARPAPQRGGGLAGAAARVNRPAPIAPCKCDK